MTAPSAQVDVRAPRFALLDAATGSCPGCELYLIARRALPART